MSTLPFLHPPPEPILLQYFTKPAAAATRNPRAVWPVNRVHLIGRNYAAHAAEMGDDPKKSSPFFFQKPASAIVDTTKTSALKYPRDTTNYHYEAELVLGIGKDSAGVVPLSEARSYITSVGVGCDLTRRDLQNEAKEKRRPWDDSKGVEDSGPIGGLIEVGEGENWWYSGKIAFWVRGSKASIDGRKHSFNSLSLLHNSPIPFRGFVADLDRGRS